MKIIGKRLKCKGSRHTIPTRMDFDGKLDVQAAKGKTPSIVLVAYTGKPMSPSGFRDKVIVDLLGSKFQKPKTPIIGDHETSLRIGHTTKQLVIPAGKRARSSKGMIDGPQIYAEGVPSSGMGISRGFVEDAANGFPFQVSIGADIDDAYFVDEGDTVVVNGRKWKGPLIVASKTTIAELSVTVLGADRDTSATLAAKRNSTTKEIYAMNFASWVKSQGFDLKTLTAKQKASLRAQWESEKALKAKKKTAVADPPPRRTVKKVTAKKVPTRLKASRSDDPLKDDKDFLTKRRELLANDEERLDKIRAAFLNFSEDIDADTEVTPIGGGKKIKFATFKKNVMKDPDVTPDQVELVLLKASLPKPGEGGGPGIHVVQQMRDMPNKVLECALVRQCGMVKASATQALTGERYGYEEWYDEETLEASDSNKIRNLSLHQMMDIQYMQANGYAYHGNRKGNDFIAAVRQAMRKLEASGPTTMNLATVFEDSGKKIMWASYQGVNTTWQELARIEPVSDFKTHNFYRLGSAGGYKLVGVDGELEHGGFTEDKYTHAADTYGKMVGLNRKHLINDDMGAFGRIMADLGIESAKAMEELFYILFLGSLATIFPINNSRLNYISGATSVLGIEGLTSLSTQFGNQVDADNSPILMSADRILVGTNNAILANQVFNNSRVELPPGSTETARTFVDNPFSKSFRPIVSPFVNNTAIKQRVSKINAGAAISGQTQTGWFLFSSPQNPAGSTMIVSLLNGNRLPFLESADAAFDVLGMQWRGYHDFGVDIGDYRFAAMSKGAA